eukprot:gnl/MRDRNA2_/MRDRNA2_142383_c0_seq1.p1 gnl/MRDRNA2_/MRDRNA2_142383_c0~~gnl/MRDRNA2_/MRDRNA2_142383_c0_seq1.p1  ORF type:complete len:444 (+),score=66.51 gnl/MRDRNA2_/MRDRNA2_142383_c0_seq1:114-1445(+)
MSSDVFCGTINCWQCFSSVKNFVVGAFAKRPKKDENIVQLGAHSNPFPFEVVAEMAVAEEPWAWSRAVLEDSAAPAQQWKAEVNVDRTYPPGVNRSPKRIVLGQRKNVAYIIPSTAAEMDIGTQFWDLAVEEVPKETKEHVISTHRLELAYMAHEAHDGLVPARFQHEMNQGLPYFGMGLLFLEQRISWIISTQQGKISFLCGPIVARAARAYIAAQGKLAKVLSVVEVQPGQLFEIDTLLWAMPVEGEGEHDLYPPGCYIPALLPLFQAARGPVSPERDTVVYMTRKGQRRALADEEALLARLQSTASAAGKRFHVFKHQGEPGNDDQLCLFQRAVVVIGLHGGALCNICWCQPGTHLIEIGFSPELIRTHGNNLPPRTKAQVCYALRLRWWQVELLDKFADLTEMGEADSVQFVHVNVENANATLKLALEAGLDHGVANSK